MDRRSDVFSLGVVLWECLAQRRLFHADNAAGILLQVLEARRVAPSAYRPEVPAALDAIALRALHVDPRQRFQSAAEMKRALDDVIWQARCGAGDVQQFMTTAFGDRMRKRQAMLAECSRESAPLLELKGPEIFRDETSGIRPQPPLPRALSPQRIERHRAKRGWLAGTVLAAGMMIGVGFGVRTIAGAFGRNNEVQAKPVDAVKPVPRATFDTSVLTPTSEPIDDAPVRSRLRPEHLEPVRVELPREDVKVADLKETKPVEPRREPPEIKPAKIDFAAAKELYTKGSEQFLAGNFVEAVAVYKQALAIDRNLAAAHRGLGMAYQRMGFDALAIASFKSYLALVPGAADAGSIQKRIEQLGGDL
jgi:hypothetical protein